MKIFKKFLIGLFSVLVLLLVVGGAGLMFFFHKAESSADNMYAPAETTTNMAQVNLSKSEPFSVLLLGIDTGEYGRTEQGRSDTIILATVNEQKATTTMVSIPRDTYVDIVGYGTKDKINHAYAFGGAGMSIDTVSQFLSIPINHYVAVNMGGLEKIIDTVGNIEVDNNLDFTSDNQHFSKGKITLNSKNVLAYVRMRYDDPNGDYGRQERQRNVIVAIAKKMMSIQGALNLNETFNVLSQYVKTDFTFDEMKTLLTNYGNAGDTINSVQMEGTGMMLNGISYQDVDSTEVARIHNLLSQQLQK